jgi:hypothetical protein
MSAAPDRARPGVINGVRVSEAARDLPAVVRAWRGRGVEELVITPVRADRLDGLLEARRALPS